MKKTKTILNEWDEVYRGLEPCPICGEIPVLKIDQIRVGFFKRPKGIYHVFCPNHCIQPVTLMSLNEAAAVWNARARRQIGTEIKQVRDIKDHKILSYQDKIVTLIEAHGVEETLFIAVEELAELIQAISKWYRYNGNKGQSPKKDVRESVIEETADVKIIIDMLSEIMDISRDSVVNAMDRKMKRNMKRITAEEKE